jgi:hypothetical protein
MRSARGRKLHDTGVVGVYLPDTSEWTVDQYRAALDESRKITLYWIQLSAEQDMDLRRLDESLPPRLFHPDHPLLAYSTTFRTILQKRAGSDAAKVYAGQVIDHLIYMVQNHRSETPFRSKEDLVLWLESRKHTTG